MHVLDITDVENRMRAPELRALDWLDMESLSVDGLPPSLQALRRRVVLIDFWDYTCVNCLHTLPYLKEWHRRYAAMGLVILGIHAPEFAFSKTRAFVEAGVREFELPYPVALDNEYATWNAYGNRSWPAKYLIDAEGLMRAYHFGEGAYEEFEEQIQKLLQEAHSGEALSFPPLMKPVWPLDVPGTLCQRPTPERYLGYRRGELGNRESQLAEQAVHYAMPEHLTLDTVYLEGDWFSAAEYVEKVNEAPGQILLQYRAAEVNLVLMPPEDRSAQVFVVQDCEFLSKDAWGEDVREDEFGKPYVLIDRPRMYRLVKNPDFETHKLALSMPDSGIRVYAFTFVSCPAKDTALA